jgi:hypothetical protein
MIQTIPTQSIYGSLHYLDGKSLTDMRKVSKFFMLFIDLNERFLYETCVRVEYPLAYSKWSVVDRYDWKDLYELVQTSTRAQKSCLALSKTLKTYNQRKEIGKVVDYIHIPLLIFSFFMSGLKLYAFGTKATRDLVSQMLKQNPGMTLLEAYQKICPGKYPLFG